MSEDNPVAQRASQILSEVYRQHAGVWEIVQEVAKSEPGIPSEIDGDISCFYCGGDRYDSRPPRIAIDRLYHEPNCTYVKARALVAQHKQLTKGE